MFGPPVTMIELLNFFLLETLILELFKYDQLHFSAINISFKIGLKITPHFTS